MIARKHLRRPIHPLYCLNAPVAVLSALALLSLAGAAQARSGQDKFTRETARAKAILAKMTLDEKIGQLIQVEHGSLKDSKDVDKYHVGSVFGGGGSGPRDYTLKGWTEMAQGFATTSIGTRLGVPIVYGTDALHGNNNVPGATIFPHNIGLGATRDPALVRKVARATAEEVRATGINWSFAPCVTVPQDYHWGRVYEGYGQDPALVAQMGAAAVEGLQGNNLAGETSVLACVKHFAADGGTDGGHDQGDAKIDEATLRRVHLPGFAAAIQAGAGTIMPSFSSWNGVKCSGHKHLLTDILKKDMGFEGFLISDWNAIDELGGDYKKDAEISLNAGMDMFMITDKYQQFFDNVKALVAEGAVPQSRIDDAVLRILRVKLAMGMMEKKYTVAVSPAVQKTFGSAAHRQIARQAVRESLVLLKNDRQTLPIAKTIKRIHVCGRGGDDVGMQCGGWTITWQGQMGDVPGGTSILNAIKKSVSPATAVTYSKDGTGAEGASLGIVVVGEIPYAEGVGDRTDLALPQEDRDAIANLKKANIPIVVVLLSGRPMILGDILAQSDAVVAAWLPGTEGQGVTDVLFGDYKPTGKLSFPWPRAMSQIPLHYDDKAADPLFPYGFGLGYHG
ncbi:beta-glucosidase [Capsulimonas corticalis]|uniref:beta-glucosidase n=1 Tax=Capsulimonas corticalis TaxID=2219043 RepID=A0A402D0C7_9BACT|nr:glycoside hydrolase family 3 N-terminal domain-containing protein [Capsulimonas corticalis]BDI33673.1 beta-glucosidase [Capsulimonas corticalis]